MGQDLGGSRWSCPCLRALRPTLFCCALWDSEACPFTGDSAWPTLTAQAWGEGWLHLGEGFFLPQG